MTWKTNQPSYNAFIRGDFGSPKRVNFMSFIKAYASASVTNFRLRMGTTQAAVDGTAEYDSGVQPFVSPAIDTPDGKFTSHFEIPTVQEYRWYRIDLGNLNAFFESPALCLGEKVEFATYYNNTSGFSFGYDDMSEIEWGRYGVVDSTDGIGFRTLEMQFGWLTDLERKTKLEPLLRILKKKDVAFWCFDPDATTDRDGKTYWGWLQKPVGFTPSTFRQNRYEAAFRIRSMI
jgi:hypothetical protein